jgi:hypothetical protein
MGVENMGVCSMEKVGRFVVKAQLHQDRMERRVVVVMLLDGEVHEAAWNAEMRQ